MRLPPPSMALIPCCLFWFLCFLTVDTLAEVRFLSMGDWGAGTTTQKDVAKQMALTAASNNIQFVLALGDNFYENGVKSDTDPLWKSYYRDVYNQSSLDVPWYPILGNHDWNGNPMAQIEYFTNTRDLRWAFPNFYYTKHISSASCDVGSCVNFTIDLVFIDTTILEPELYNDYFSSDPNKYTDGHMKWLEQQLSTSVATWTIVVGHFPVVSLGAEGDTDTLIWELKPLLEHYNVDVYLCGHDHTLQHISNNGVTYFVNGNAGKADGAWGDTKSEHLHKHQYEDEKIGYLSLSNGFMMHEITHKQLTTYFIDEHGEVLYNVTIEPRGKMNGSHPWAPSLAVLGIASCVALFVWIKCKRKRQGRAKADASNSTLLQNEDDEEVIELEMAQEGSRLIHSNPGLTLRKV